MKNILSALFLLFISSIFGQDIQRQMISSQGNSIAVSNGMYVSQSIGQQSLTGTSQKNNLTISQGYQQSLWNTYIKKNNISLISTKTYPNPFHNIVYFEFSKPIHTSIQITLFDITGRIVFQETKKANETILSISNLNLPSATYLVHLSSDKLNYYTKIIQSK